MTEHGSRQTTAQMLAAQRQARIARRWWAQVIGLCALVVAVALALWWRA